MAGYQQQWLLVVGILSMVLLANGETQAQEAVKTYIVHMARWKMPPSYATHEHWYASIAESMSVEVLYHYSEVFHGFAARLSAAQAESLQMAHGVLGINPEKVYELHTTRTPEFLGLTSNVGLWPQSGYGEDVIVGVLDTGVWPERASFADAGFGPVPMKWKGECAGGKGFQCNKKLIGARFFRGGSDAAGGNNDALSARDDDGHGTHTSSTAAGSFVEEASILGYANGTARGMAAHARVAAYKVCWVNGCYSSDILAAMDKAVADGVNVLSLSLGGDVGPYYADSVAVGAFGAMEKGVFVSCSAGNSGPDSSTLSNVAPWIATVGASTLDRDFPAYALLGDGKRYHGVSLYQGKALPEGQLPLIYAGNASLSGAQDANLCLQGTLDPKLVVGKIVLCDRGQNARVAKGGVVKAAGGAGMILANTADNGEELVVDAHLLPTTAVGEKDGNIIKQYLFSVASPTVTIGFGGTVLGVKPAPVMAAFSSRGPNPITTEILKPDITAPGVNILAAWTGAAGPTGLATDSRRVPFNIISGTSMSCPHVSGIAALLKGAHQEWSPAAIKSALMTTARVLDNAGGSILDIATGKPSTPFDHGAGHVDPQGALSPGLVYDLDAADYLSFLCSLNYTDRDIQMLSRRNFTCSGAVNSPSNLNYPSLVVNFVTPVVNLTRTVTNVGEAGSTYTVSVSATPEVGVEIEPTTLHFTELGEKQTYSVVFTSKVSSSVATTFGSLTWTDGKYKVRSPVVYTWPGAQAPMKRRQGESRATLSKLPVWSTTTAKKIAREKHAG
uniref:Subtilisin-like protease n=2 Tax=Araucaria cunninghamii TaxID=56994 RepID=A0A0D6QRP6_ARACU